MGYYDPKDGRRTSNPMTSINSSPAQAPDWQLCRVVDAQDATFDEKKMGVNCGTYQRVRFSVVPYDKDPTIDDTAVPGGTANPDIEVLIWSESAGAFLSFDDPIIKSGAGAGTAYMVDVENANGAILLLAITNALSGDIAAISVQGHYDELL